MIEFKLPDMSCGHCASTVTKTLQRADPACKVTVDLPSHTVHVQATAPREVLAEALTEAGYPPSAPLAPLAPAAPSAPA